MAEAIAEEAMAEAGMAEAVTRAAVTAEVATAEVAMAISADTAGTAVTLVGIGMAAVPLTTAIEDMGAIPILDMSDTPPITGTVDTTGTVITTMMGGSQSAQAS